MIIYNVTCNVENEILQDWASMDGRDSYSRCDKTGFFLKANINKVISSNDDGTTYAII